MSHPEIVCNLCHAKVDKVLLGGGITSVMKCDQCGLVFRKVAAELSEKELFAFTSKFGDVSKNPTTKYGASYREDDNRVLLWEKVIRDIDRLALSNGKELLDIGSGKGVFLDIARKGGWQPTGVEPWVTSATYARQVFGLSVFTGTLEEAHFPSDRFDVATMWDVIEHLKDPATTVAEAFRVLKPGGLLYVLTPNHDSLITLLAHWLYEISFQKLPLERLLYPPVHLYYFTPKTLGDLLSRSGFNIVRVGSAPLHPEKCLVSNGMVRVGTSAIDFLGRPLKRGYRIAIIASKPQDEGAG